MRDEIDDGRYYEHCDEHTASPVCWGKIAVTHSAHRDHDQVVGLKECQVVVNVNTKEVMKHTNPVREKEYMSMSERERGEGGKEMGRERERGREGERHSIGPHLRGLFSDLSNILITSGEA